MSIPRRDIMSEKHKHKDTAISLHPLSIEEALKIAMDAGPMPEKAEDTKPAAPQRSGEGRKSAASDLGG
jgi:hypothetical protein